MSIKRKICLFLCVLLIFASAAPVFACWRAPEPFEVFSEDGTRVFVFNPATYDNAYAAVYSISDEHERQLVYTVEDLASLSYESNFHFSYDMNHFARTLNWSGLPIFEVFSNGIRTRTVLRSDIIEDYERIESFTSIGPVYNVAWRIENFSSDNFSPALIRFSFNNYSKLQL